MRYRRMPIEIESPEQLGYDTITNNLSESSVADRRLADLGLDARPRRAAALLRRPPRRPGPAGAGRRGRRRARADDVLVTPGAAAALFCVATSLLEPGDHAVVVRTNYATNLETPRAIGADSSTSSTCASTTAGGSTSTGSPRCVRPRHAADQRHVPAQPDRHDAHRRRAARGGRARRGDRAPCCSSTRPTATSPTASRCRWPPTLSPRAISVVVDVEGLRPARAARRLGRSAATASSRETLLAAKEQMVICGADASTRRSPARCWPTATRILPPILDRRRSAPRDRARLDRRPGHVRVGRAGGRRRRPRAVPRPSRGRHRPLLRRAARRARHLRRPRPLVRVDDRHFRLGFGWPTTDELERGLANVSAALDAASR